MILRWTTPCSTSRTPPPWLQDRSAFRCTRSRLDHDYDYGGSRDGDFFMAVVMMMIVVVVIMRVENGPDDDLNDGEERKMMKMMKRGGFIFIREEA